MASSTQPAVHRRFSDHPELRAALLSQTSSLDYEAGDKDMNAPDWITGSQLWVRCANRLLIPPLSSLCHLCCLGTKGLESPSDSHGWLAGGHALPPPPPPPPPPTPQPHPLRWGDRSLGNRLKSSMDRLIKSSYFPDVTGVLHSHPTGTAYKHRFPRCLPVGMVEQDAPTPTCF